MMCISSQENSLSPNETEIADRKKQISKCKIIRVLPRHPTQRHCPIRQGPIKRKKRRFRCTSINLPLNQDISSSRVSINSLSLSQTSTSSSSSICSPPRNIAQPVKKRKTAIDKCDGRGETALHKAAIKGDIKLVKSLLRRGANPNHQDYAGWTPLHEACIRGWYNVAQALLKAGANANTPGLHNVTALHDATAWSHISLVKLLLKYGANLTSKNDKGDTPLALASGTVRNYLENHGFIPELIKILILLYGYTEFFTKLWYFFTSPKYPKFQRRIFGSRSSQHCGVSCIEKGKTDTAGAPVMVLQKIFKSNSKFERELTGVSL
ncbi:hypothetical protein PGB90_009045 [Kerria lacca]